MTELPGDMALPGSSGLEDAADVGPALPEAVGVSSSPPPMAYAQRAPGAPVRLVGKTRNPWGVWLLGLVTLGIYSLYWYYTVNRELRDYDPRIVVQPGIALVAVIFSSFTLGIAAVISWVRTGGRICKGQQYAGSNNRCSGLVGFLLGVIGFGTVYYQSQINKIWDVYANPPAGTPIAA